MNKIKALREKLGLSQSQLAEVLGISVRTIQSWDIDRRYPTEYYERLLLDEMRRATGTMKEMRIQFKACYTDTDRDWYGEYHDTLEDAIDEVKSLYDKDCMHGYVYRTALALDENGEWTEEKAIELGWTGDTMERFTVVYDVKEDTELE